MLNQPPIWTYQLKPMHSGLILKKLCQDAIDYQMVNVCIHPHWVAPGPEVLGRNPGAPSHRGRVFLGVKPNSTPKS